MDKNVDESKTRPDVGCTELLDVIEDMIVEYSNMAYDNHHRYPTDEELDLVRLGIYGERALVDLKNRIKSSTSNRTPPMRL